MSHDNGDVAEADRRTEFLVGAAAAYAAAAALGPDPELELWDATLSDGQTD